MRKKKIFIYITPRPIPHEKIKCKEEDKLVIANTQRKHIRYNIRDALQKNKRPPIATSEGISPSP
jgi:hypothetical protein